MTKATSLTPRVALNTVAANSGDKSLHGGRSSANTAAPDFPIWHVTREY